MNDALLDNGTVIGEKYRIDRPIGRGGFSTVYLGTHTAMERTVAIKLFDPSAHGDGDTTVGKARAARFEQEARLVSQLEHPNTVTIFDFGVEEDGKAFLVMEFIEGRTLTAEMMAEAPMDSGRAIGIFMQILASLEEAHHRGVLHRDLKPANVMLATNFKHQEIVKVLDFGIARLLRDRTDQQERNLFLGTPRYAAPEQLTGAELSLATDIYALGAMFWEAVVGEPMVPSNDLRECISHATSAARWQLPDDVDVSSQVASIIETAVSKSPDDRYDDAAAMLRALESCETLEQSALPEFDDNSPFAGTDSVFDPNLTDDDAPDLLDDRAGSSTTASKRNPPRPGRRSSSDSSNRRPTGGAEDLELDLPGPGEPGGPQPRSRRSRRGDTDKPSLSRSKSVDESNGSRLARLFDSVVDQSGILPVVGIGFAVVAIGLFGIVVLMNHSDDDAPDIAALEQQMTDRHGDNSGESFDLPEHSPYTIDGIVTAVRSQGWRIQRARDPIEMPAHTLHTRRLDSNGRTITLRLYVGHSEGAIRNIERDINTPDRYVTFDHIVAAISPDDFSARRGAAELEDFLQQYRDTVAGKAEQ